MLTLSTFTAMNLNLETGSATELPVKKMTAREGKENVEPVSYKDEKEWLTKYYEPELKQICDKLDRLLIRKLELIQEYISVSLQNERYMKEGYIQIAKSRYIMGPKSVSRTNLPTETDSFDDAVLTVESDFVDKCDIGSPVKQFTTKSDSVKKDDVKLRKLFGVLTPQSLKKTQQNFQSSINCIVDLVNLSAELELTQTNFIKVLQEKKILLKSDYASFCCPKK